ncbi:hypothetical protein [Bdellovibrio sp. HCB2-146]|uniref:hypothetical protein n=1 Tax=Bdellovibrio sp. HCB2-146 TaxID=3394362 RepID=UPI0039BCB4E1
MKSSKQKQPKKKPATRRIEPTTPTPRSERSMRTQVPTTGQVHRTADGTIEENSEEAAP